MFTGASHQQFRSVCGHSFSQPPCHAPETRYRARLALPAPLVLLVSVMCSLVTDAAGIGALHASSASVSSAPAGSIAAGTNTIGTNTIGAAAVQPRAPEQQVSEQQASGQPSGQQAGQAGIMQDAASFKDVIEEPDIKDVIEEIVITGSRRARGSAADTPAPVDMISGQEFTDQASGDLSSLLRTLVPSYNVGAQPISDGGTFVRPANLRGLAPDQTLVLLNGKRRHRSAVIAFFGGNGVSDGAQGPDIATIPALALKRVEVLRDGAAAQYGSDAIAGVINFVLRDAPEGGTIEAKYGSTYEGDGDRMQVAANIGLPLKGAGFVNVTAEWRQADPTSRSVQRADAAALIAAGNQAVRQPFAQIWGSPTLHYDGKLFLNLGLDLGGGHEVYAFGNYARRHSSGGFYFRNPNNREGVNSLDGGLTRLVGDLTPFDERTCPGGTNLNPGEMGTGTIPDPHRVGSPDDAARLAALSTDPDCFVFNELFPGGFTPQFGGRLNDRAGTMGARGSFGGGFRYDISLQAGRNQIDYEIDNTVNPSLGPLTPTFFELGSYIQLEKTLNADFSWPLEIGLHSPLNVAFGAEWREEQFDVRVGEPASWEAGILARPLTLVTADGTRVTVSQGFGVGANGFNGFSPQVAGRWDRTNIALYLDLEADMTEGWVLGAAVRYEDFSDFGSTTNFKLSTLVRLKAALRLRGTVSSGFRAPTPGQQQVINVTTAVEPMDGQVRIIQRGTLPPTNPVATRFGGEPLGPETSRAFTLGLSTEIDTGIGALSLTMDYFNIRLRDRITQSATIRLGDAERAALVASGVGFAADLQAFRFFVNDFETVTDGIDLVASLPLPVSRSGTSLLTFSGNHTTTRVARFNPATLNACRVRQLQEALPRTRFSAGLSHREPRWRWLMRANYHSRYFESHAGDGCGLPITGAGALTLDLEIAWTVKETMELAVGAENLFDKDPHRNPHALVTGARYPETAPFGLDGGRWYARARVYF